MPQEETFRTLMCQLTVFQCLYIDINSIKSRVVCLACRAYEFVLNK